MLSYYKLIQNISTKEEQQVHNFVFVQISKVERSVSTQEADLERVAKAKRCSGFMESLALTKRRMACLMESNLVSGRPFGPVLFISTSDSASTSMHNSMSSLLIRVGFSVYLLAPDPSPSTTIPSISLSLSLSRMRFEVMSSERDDRNGAFHFGFAISLYLYFYIFLFLFFIFFFF
jgi:hypothetical protein